MDQSLENKIKLKDKLANFYKFNKSKIHGLILIIIILVCSLIFIKYKNDQKNIIMSEKYINAGIYLASKDKENAKLIYEEIILSKNKFYSILALNAILENNLVSNKDKIFEYFEILENTMKSNEQKNLLMFKKALYLIKNQKIEKGNNLLKDLIDNNTSLKSLAEELIKK